MTIGRRVPGAFDEPLTDLVEGFIQTRRSLKRRKKSAKRKAPKKSRKRRKKASRKRTKARRKAKKSRKGKRPYPHHLKKYMFKKGRRRKR